VPAHTRLNGTRGMKDKAFSRCTYRIVPPGSANCASSNPFVIEG
jgi:hypothetical protein